jgi:glycosyltransferase involved in cell wall biosynthesis
MNSKVQISVLLPVYNGEKYLKDSIDSILNQSFIDFELIIVNDGSNDNSDIIIKSYTDGRIKYIKHNLNTGLVNSLNAAIATAKGKFLARMDQDDIAQQNRLELQYQFLEKNETCVLLGTQIKVLGNNIISKMYCESDELKTALIFGNTFAHSTIMMRKSIIDRYQLKYETDYEHAEDYGLWIRLSNYGDINNLNEVGVMYRKHSNQYSIVFKEEMKLTRFKIIHDYCKALKLGLDDEEILLLQNISNYKNRALTHNSLLNCADVFNKLLNHLVDKKMNRSFVEKVLYRKWKRIFCDTSSITNSYDFKLYKKFRSSVLDLKFNLWLLNKIFKNKFSI